MTADAHFYSGGVSKGTAQKVASCKRAQFVKKDAPSAGFKAVFESSGLDKGKWDV